MDRRALLGTLAMGAAAGCLRLEGGSDTTTSGGATETTVQPRTTTERDSDGAVDEETTERGEATYPFGLSEDGVESFLYSTCRTAVADRSYRSQYTKVDVESGEQRWHREYEAADEAALGHWTRKNGGPVDIFHTIGGEALWREAVGDRYTYGLNRGDSFQKIFWDEEFQPLLAGPDWSAPERVDDGRPAVWEVSADSVSESVTAPGHMDGELRSVDGARLRIDENGVIRRLEAAYSAYDSRSDQTRAYRFRFVLSDVGSVSLSEPSWLGTARDRRPRVSAALTDDRRYVRIRMESGAIAPGSRISVFDRNDDGTKFVSHTDRRLETGDVVYLYSLEDASGHNDAALGYGDRSAPGTPPELPGEYHLVPFRRDSKYHPGVDVAPPN